MLQEEGQGEGMGKALLPANLAPFKKPLQKLHQLLVSAPFQPKFTDMATTGREGGCKCRLLAVPQGPLNKMVGGVEGVSVLPKKKGEKGSCFPKKE